MILGIVLLTVGAEGLVEGSLRLSRRLGVSPLVAGLTVVAFGTSAPELGVSLSAALKGVSDVALGNVLGSNIANALLIVGIGAMLHPFTPHSGLVRRELPILLGVSFVAWAFAYQGVLTELFGLLGLLIFFGYIFYLYRAKEGADESLKEISEEVKKSTGLKYSVIIEVFLVVGGLIALFFGSKVFLKGALDIGYLLEVPELFVGLTLTAVGTSLPEIAATVSAARRGQGDIIMGNVIGSNLANLCFVMAVTSIFTPIPVPRLALIRDFPVMVISGVLLLLLVQKKTPISRFQGAALILFYFIYVLFLKY